MRRIEYRKTGERHVVVNDTDIDTNRKPESRIERFNAFFQNVPLWGGQEWKTLSVDEIIFIFRGASVDLLEVYQQRHDEAIREHSMRNRFARWWREFRGWKAPYVPLQEEIVQDIAARCKDLSNWMRQNSSRPFYAGSDMSVFIHKPAAVAERLIAA
jgi:hypothetical protein